MMRNLKPLFAATLLLSLGGCVSFGEDPPSRLLTLVADQIIPTGQQRSATGAEAITIVLPTVPQALATTRVAVSDGPNGIAYVKDAAWVEAPNRLFRALLAEKVSAVTGRVVLDPRQSSMDPGLRVTGQLQRFGLDALQSQAVILYDAVVSRTPGGPVETRRFEARVPVAAHDGMNVAAGLNTAANQIATELAGWLVP